ncbi:MAG: YceI family protein, partial [Candidatus Omnitrophica bacterium]|nr:YceI family protein [Candidatus Omnitrophota bacterium]
ISIPVSVVGPVEGMGGGMVVGIAGETTINRQDFGVSWSKTLDGGGLVVGDEVKLTIEIEAHAK